MVDDPVESGAGDVPATEAEATQSVDAVPEDVSAESAVPAEEAPAETSAASAKPVVEDASGGAPVAPTEGGEPTTSGESADDGDAQASGDARAARGQRRVGGGIAHVAATFNNTRVTISDRQGNVVSWCTGGQLGFKGSRKSTSYVAQQVGAEAAKRAMAVGMREVDVHLKGPGAGRESAVRGIAAAGMDIALLRDVTPVPHNGCRPPKRRRV